MARTGASDLALELGEADAADRRRRADEAEVDHLLREPERVEDLRAAVGGDVGDPHLGHDLQHAVLDRRAEAPLRLGRRRPVAADLVRGGERRDRLEREPRADRLGAVAEQAGDVVCLARLVGLDDERRSERRPARDQALVDGADGEQHRESAPALGWCPTRAARSGRARTNASASSARRRQAPSRPASNGRVEPVQTLVEHVRVEEEALELHARERSRAPPSSRGARPPRMHRRENVCRSRRWSIGGFVTCAKRWRK